jgi:DHA3 family macrolide efflux protein-like MFS transporter
VSKLFPEASDSVTSDGRPLPISAPTRPEGRDAGRIPPTLRRGRGVPITTPAPAIAESGLPLDTGRPSFGRALRNRPFFLLWVSQLISQSGDYVFEVALLWLVLEATGSVFDVGLVVVATLVPVVVLGPFLGVYADRWPRRTLLLVTNLAEGVLVAGLSGLVLTHGADLSWILGIVVALATGAQVVRITSNAMIPQTVRVEDLAPANSLLSFSSSFNQVVGLSLGGIVVAVFGVAIPIEYDAISFFAAAAIITLIPRAVGAPEPAAEGADTRFRAQFSEGLRYLLQQRFLVEIIIIGVVGNFCVNAVSALIAPYADYVLHGGSTTYGFLGAAIAAGSILGAAIIGKIDTRHSAGQYLFGGAAAVGLMIIALGVTRSIPFALAEAFGIGVVLSISNIPIFVVIQAKVPGRLMGRVTSVLFALLLIASPLGAFFAGSFAAATSIGFVLVVAGAVETVAILLGWAVMRELRTVTY